MPLIPALAARAHELHGARFVTLASPSLGAAETSVWRVVLPPDLPPTEHRVTREEVFVVLAGRGVATLDGVAHALAPGDALVLPADVAFTLRADGPAPLEALVCFPVGGQAVIGDAPPFTPPWAA